MAGFSSLNAWDDALDDVEAHLYLVERFLAGEPVEPRPYERPFGLGPLPREHHSRATTLRSATTEMDERLPAILAALDE